MFNGHSNYIILHNVIDYQVKNGIRDCDETLAKRSPKDNLK